jgi:hypothetical protein
MANEQNLKPFQKGHKLSKGKPKGAKHLSTVLKEMLAQKIPTKKSGMMPATELIVMGLIGRAIRGDVSAFREIMDRTEGKVVQSIKSEGTLDVTALDLSTMTTEQIHDYLSKHKMG